MADLESSTSGERLAEAPPRSRLWVRTGIVLLGLSLVLWIPVPAVPFLPLSLGAKAALGGGLVVAAEVAFWLGALLAGPEAVKRIKSWARGALARRRPRAK